MATKRAAPKPKLGIGSVLAEPEVPSGHEVADAIEQWRAAAAVAVEYRIVEEDARRRMVDVLHRAGVKGLVL